MIEKFEGCILGLAIGDALGMPAEGMSREKIKEIYGEIRDFLPSPYGDLKEGEWTDDTEQALLLAESIIETKHFSPENFAERLKQWFYTGRRIGPTSRAAIIRLLRGANWYESGLESDTCGSAIRVAPIGLVYHFNFNMVEKYAEISSRVTHTGMGAIASAIAVAIAIACKMLDFSDEEMLAEVVSRVEDYDSLLADKIRFAYDIRNKELDYAVEKLGNTISALDVVPIAFYCFFSEKDFEKAILKSANAGGDADSISAICGSIKGIEGISSRFLDKLKDIDVLKDVAFKLYKLHLSIAKVI
ncbi:MAG: ADP-ribosylglycohydrolase family protein [Archaeoglobaceae archaeon]|nr:ADP-ribosylglycohydrolase family protein [Archaeoglobaceae archaeon]MCX8172615.1 ADP-ribosylglycohydrolase family protein [Archaeoglobaceae archaeon]MDW7989462.1 ADP-ribosylglycohydrolase family protein [Archaeoglobaceae archaeon]